MTDLQPITATRVTMTPAWAKDLMRSNTHNRNTRHRAVADYARDMAAGNWPFNGDAIRVSSDGRVLDGQHRLQACILADAPFDTMLITGLPPETQDTMDSGIKRMTSDMLTLNGETNSTVLGAILIRIWKWDRGDRTLKGNATPTRAEILDTLRANPSARRSAEMAAMVQGKFKFSVQSATGLSHHLFNKIDQDQAALFMHRLADGANMDEFHPIMTIRNRMMRDAGDNRTKSDTKTTVYLVKAWNAMRAGEDMARVQYSPGQPIPEPK